MTTADRWQLPDGIEEVLPQQAAAVEHLRRKLLDLYQRWGYQLVIPPLVEFTDSLLIGLGADLDLLTFRLTDQLSGRMMGVRADITPQVARIDAHSLAHEGVSRLCYAGSTLHTRPKKPLASRSPIQLGAELYGDPGLDADKEIIRLMLATLETAGLKDITLDLGHVGIYSAVLKAAQLDAELEAAVFDALQRKSGPDLERVLSGVDDNLQSLLMALLQLHGGLDVLDRARELLSRAAPDALPALDILAEVAGLLAVERPDISIYFDLAELRGYHYHTGMVFAAYVPGRGQAVANGGRYDAVGEVFGRARPATGFATDLKALMNLVPATRETQGAIAAPAVDDVALQQRIGELRAAGEIVITSLLEQADARCDRELRHDGDGWQVAPLPQ